MKKTVVDKKKCIGCGTCVAIASKSFQFDKNGKAEPIAPAGDDEITVKDALDSCPVQAIEWRT